MILYLKDGNKTNEESKTKYVDEAILFAKDYRNSPGFKERWSKIGKKGVTRRLYSKYDPNEGFGKLVWNVHNFNNSNKINYWEGSSNASYFPEKGFYIGTNKLPVEAMSNWKDELTHEVGHYFETNIKPTYIDDFNNKTPAGNYFSDIYPIFRNSKSYKDTLELLSNDEDIKDYEKDPSFNYYNLYLGEYLDSLSDAFHDGTPTESYADLFLLRKKLLDSGIYDIRKANNPFTQDHLKKFKKLNKDKIRLFDNFSDKDIIWMMNNVAQNTNKSSDSSLNFYAKQGGIIEFLKKGSGIHIKKKNRGKFTAYCGGNVTSACIAKAKASGNPTLVKRATFAANARKWKHLLGGRLYNAGSLPEIIVNGYAPMRLTTYYPFISKYRYTGHSKLDIPIDRKTWVDYTGEEPSSDRIAPYMTIDKKSWAKDYNLVTNNCADATLSYLNKAFNTSESPALFTTPGDVRDYAINKLHGKVIKNNNGSDTVLIPRNKNNALKLSTTALDMFNGEINGTAGVSYKAMFKKLKGGKLCLIPRRK